LPGLFCRGPRLPEGFSMHPMNRPRKQTDLAP
jgi:hypothetical protein